MTGDTRMPAPGNPTFNTAANFAIGLAVACGLQASRWALALASRRADRKLVRAEERSARHERRPHDSWERGIIDGRLDQ